MSAGTTESYSTVDQLGSEVEKLKQLMTPGSSFIPTGNRTMPAWGKSGYSHCQLPFSWTELIKVLRFYSTIVSPFLFLFHPSCFIDDSCLFTVLRSSISLYFFCLYDVFQYIHYIRGPKSVKLCSGLEVSVIVYRKICTRAGCAFAVILSSAGSIMR